MSGKSIDCRIGYKGEGGAGIELCTDEYGRVHALHFSENGADEPNDATLVQPKPGLRWQDILTVWGDLTIPGIHTVETCHQAVERAKWEQWTNSLLDPTLPRVDPPEWVESVSE